MPDPASVKLHYWDFPFWRGECIRMALFFGEISFDDERHNNPVELFKAGKLPFGEMPILEIDGKILSQTHSIANYVSHLAGLQPKNPWLIAKVDECICGCEDITLTLHDLMTLVANAGGRGVHKLTQKFIDPEDGKLHMFMKSLEAIVEENGMCGHAIGDSMTIADFAIWLLLNSLEKPPFDNLGTEWIKERFPGLQGVMMTVEAEPKVIEWKSQFDYYDADGVQ
mmetsp:Transcript_26365/g.39944  ORF Transcript_26365/g.39944 Transcript_26365/m.39944 type:complete len:225 (+) Transcript_26365:128-802(+)